MTRDVGRCVKQLSELFIDLIDSLLCCSRRWMAPEVAYADGKDSKDDRGYDSSADVYSLGLLIWCALQQAKEYSSIVGNR